MVFPSKSIERTLIKRGVKWIAAVDEVGRGSWAGPVVAAAVLFQARFFHTKTPKTSGVRFQRSHKNYTQGGKGGKKWGNGFWGLRDSKLLTPEMRDHFYNLLVNDGYIRWSVASVTPTVIDRINIHRATLRAMARAVQKLPRQPDIVLVDGIFSIPGVALPQEVYPHGDRRIFSIACASIIAKVTRDRMMVRLAKKYPEYGFEKHKGYGTKLHQAQLASFGPSVIHRRSYRPVARLASL